MVNRRIDNKDPLYRHLSTVVLPRAGLEVTFTSSMFFGFPSDIRIFVPAKKHGGGAGPHHVRAMAEALGRKVPASKYSPDISLHPVFGDQDAKKQHYVECLLGPNVPVGLNST
jgi:hypothetical protein